METCLAIFSLLAVCGVFVVGMTILSSGFQHLVKARSPLVMKMFQPHNRFEGVLNGFLYSGITQSSSANCDLVIGLLNCGCITLMQGASIIFGANIGTTITSFIVSFSSFDIAPFLSVFAFVGCLPMLSKNEKVRSVGKILAGFGLLFFSVTLLDASYKDPLILDASVQLLSKIDNCFIFLAIGFVVTGIIQSSSATSAIAVFMVGASLISLKNAFFLIIGSNIGTCVTGIFAAHGGNKNTKRTTFIWFFFNIFGGILATVLLVTLGDTYIIPIFENIPIFGEFKVALFHMAFNVVTCIILLPFLKPICLLSKAIIKN